MSELLDKQVNTQKEFYITSGVHASSCKPTKKCAIKLKVETKKNDGRLTYFGGRKEFIEDYYDRL